ncbi:MAG: EamA family transporter [Rhodospirillaceae bacterium]|nr:EamA family transporter [Alphaproteobacteria bacterium]MBR73152.1 EamA family transporter [Rhodospirillaceae bacterium]|tara:strand:- start:2178 stop:3089 length:912 start_codon:yes stop_codon:yes gene_type:complete
MEYKNSDSTILHVHALTILANLLISTSFTVGHAIAHAFEPGVLMLVRFAMAAIIMGVFVYWKYGFSWPGWQGMLRYTILGLMPVGFFWCQFESLRYTSALNTSALFTTVPGISAIIAAIFIGERLGWHRLLALGVGMIGALWVVFRGDPDRFLAFDLNYGDILFLLGCLCFGAYGVLVKHLHRGEPTAIMTFWVLVVATLSFFLIAAKDIASTDWVGASFEVYGWLFYLALVTTVISFFLFQYATPRIGPTRVQAYSYFMPGLVILTEWIIGYGLPPAMTLPGIALVLITSYFIQQGSKIVKS